MPILRNGRRRPKQESPRRHLACELSSYRVNTSVAGYAPTYTNQNVTRTGRASSRPPDISPAVARPSRDQVLPVSSSTMAPSSSEKFSSPPCSPP
jgi:hypothetical protein